jgi:hypothetical protein
MGRSDHHFRDRHQIRCQRPGCDLGSRTRSATVIRALAAVSGCSTCPRDAWMDVVVHRSPPTCAMSVLTTSVRSSGGDLSARWWRHLAGRSPGAAANTCGRSRRERGGCPCCSRRAPVARYRGDVPGSGAAEGAAPAAWAEGAPRAAWVEGAAPATRAEDAAPATRAKDASRAAWAKRSAGRTGERRTARCTGERRTAGRTGERPTAAARAKDAPRAARVEGGARRRPLISVICDLFGVSRL